MIPRDVLPPRERQDTHAPLFPGVALGVQPPGRVNLCPRCGATLGVPPVGLAPDARYHLPGACPLEMRQ